MSDLLLRRQRHDDHATLGRLYRGGVAAEAAALCWTLENRPPREPGVKEPGLSRIPAGTHALGLRAAGGFYNRYTDRYDWHGPMVEILLPGWKYVLFHIGNYHRDTDGCVLIGDSPGQEDDGTLAVWKSAMAYRRVYPVLRAAAEAGGSITIEDEGAPEPPQRCPV